MDYLENTPTIINYTIIISQDSSSKYPYMVVLFGEPGYNTLCTTWFLLKYMQVSVRSGSSKSGSKSLTLTPKRKVYFEQWAHGLLIPYRKLCLPNR